MPVFLRGRSLRWLLALLPLALAGYGAWVAALALRPEPQPPRAFVPGFAGSQACAECHAALVDEHAESHHAHTLATMEQFAATSPLPEPKWLSDPELPMLTRAAQKDGVFGVEGQLNGNPLWNPTQWAFGSGTLAMTPVGQTPNGEWVEAPVTYYRNAGWDFTVGFLLNDPSLRSRSAAGRPLPPDEINACFDCHATGVLQQKDGPDLSRIEAGVQCERCHGGGAEHIRLARLGQAKGSIPNPGSGSGAENVRFCATCHRLEPPPGTDPDAPVMIRFAPARLVRSECYTETPGGLSCVSCHQPHGNSSKDPEHYKKVCSGCHGGQPHLAVCPEQPRGNCVSCHMPREIVMRNAIFTDHFIRVVRERGSGAPASARRGPDERALAAAELAEATAGR
ncbi:MAG: multiheme c-type cytochrome [Armatimonadota bacterium]